MTEEQSRQLDSILGDLLVRAESKAVFLCDRGGNIIASNTAQSYRHEDNIAALAAGSFYATRELAKMLGESEFQSVFHQGVDTSVYMQSTASDLLMLVVFGLESNPGLVKLYSTETCHALDGYLEAEGQKLQDEDAKVRIEFEIDTSKQLFKRSGC